MTMGTITDAYSFGRAVRIARKEKGLSQRALAERCGCSQRFVSELERGKATAELGKALSVFAELGLTLTVQGGRSSSDAHSAVEQLAASVSARLENKARNKTSLSDYLRE